MSAFIVDRYHIDCLVNTALAWDVAFRLWENGRGRVASPAETGRALWRENFRSVEYRYDQPASDEWDAFEWRPYSSRVLSPVEAIKAVDCLDYQSCEHPGWKDSEARRFLRLLKAEAISRLPGYEEAAWELRP